MGIQVIDEGTYTLRLRGRGLKMVSSGVCFKLHRKRLELATSWFENPVFGL